MKRNLHAVLTMLAFGIALSFLAPVEMTKADGGFVQQYAVAGTEDQTASTITFTDKNAIQFSARELVIVNDDTTNTLWVRIDGATATAASPAIQIKKGESRSFHFSTDNGPSTLSQICTSAQTALYRIEAYR